MNRSYQQAQSLSAEKLALLKQRLQQKGLGLPRKPGRRKGNEPCPLSFAQQRLWFLDQLEPDSSIYNMPVALRLSGALNKQALLQTLTVIIQRHESLRTTFMVKEDTPMQVVATVADVHLPVVDLTCLPVEKGQITRQQLISQEAQKPFDLARGPLLRLTLLCQQGNEQVLLLTMHHIISDGQSMNVLMHEITVLYNDFCQGKRSLLPVLPIQYADFALWQREWLQGEVLEEQKSYWLRQLDNLSPLELPTDHARPAVQRFRGAHQNTIIPAQYAEKLKELSQQEGVTLFMTILAAFQVLLARYSQQTDIAVGTPITNRSHTETVGVVGLFVNTLVLRLDLSGNPSFREVLARVRTVCLDAYSHQDMPFEKLVELLQPERNLSHSPLFQVLFNFYEADPATETFNTLQVQAQTGGTGTTKFDLALSVAV